MDGASTNLAMIKVLSGQDKGAYGIDKNRQDPHEVTPWFVNPQHPNDNIVFIICPTHQVNTPSHYV